MSETIPQTGLYVHLFHGRNHPTEQLSDWGFSGPVIGPVHLSWTYGDVKVHPPDWGDHWNLVTFEDLIPCGDAFYGDFEVWEEGDEALTATREDPHEIRLSYREFIDLNVVPPNIKPQRKKKKGPKNESTYRDVLPR